MATNWQDTYEKLKKKKEALDAITGNDIISNSNIKFNASSTSSSKKDDEEDKWYEKVSNIFEPWEDGYDKGDIIRTIIGARDVKKDTTKGIAINIWQGLSQKMEGIQDWMDDTSARINDGTANLLGIISDEEYEKRRKSSQEYIKQDFTKERMDKWGLDDEYLTNLEKKSLITRENIGGQTAQGVGGLLPEIALALLTGGTSAAGSAAMAGKSALAKAGASMMMNAPSTLTLATGVYGQSIEEAYNQGATDEEAFKYGVGKAAVEVATEWISGGIPGVKGTGLIDDLIAKNFIDRSTKGITKEGTKALVKSLEKAGFSIIAEGGEEALAEIIDPFLKNATYSEGETIDWNAVMESAIVGGITGGILNASSTVSSVNNAKQVSNIESEINTLKSQLNATTDVTEQNNIKKQIQQLENEMSIRARDEDETYTQNEQAVIDAEVAKRTEGQNLTKKQKSKIEAEVIEDLEKGYISTDSIESTLGGNTYNELKSVRDNKTKLETQIKELESKPNAEITVKEMEQLKALREELSAVDTNTLESKLQAEMGGLIKSDSYLQRSYQEKAKRSQEFTYKAAETDSEFRKGVMESTKGKLNDTTRSHETAEALVKLSEDRKMQYKFTNNAELTKLGLVPEGKTANGLYVVDKDGSREILVNTDSKKYIEAVLVHETSHDFKNTSPETYTKLQDITREFAEAQNEYSRVYSEVAGMYKNVEGVDINEEVTARLLEDYVGNKEFISSLTTKEPNIVQKIINEIKYLVKKFTAGSPEARKLVELQHTLEKTYREAYKQTKAVNAKEGTKLSANDKIQGLETYSKDEIKQLSKDYIEQKLEENGIYDVEIKDIAIHGSRGRGTAKVDSDLDVVVEYEGDIREDDLFNILNEDPMFIDDIQVDINPITESMNDYMARSDAYDQEILSKQTTKYSLDNQGRKLTKEQADYFKDSKVRDENGNLLTMYHGTGAEFTIFDINKSLDKGNSLGAGFYFTSSKEFAESINKNTIEVYLDIKNPYIIDKNVDLFDLYDQLGEPDTLYNYFISHGYDGIIYNNGEEVVVYNPNQIKKIDNLNPTKNPDIRYSLDNQGRELSKGQQEYFKDSKAREDDGSLTTVYHTSPNYGFTKFEGHKGEGYYRFSKYGAEIAFFTDNKVMSESYTRKSATSGTYEGYLNLKNPLIVDANGRNWDRVTREHSQEIVDRYNKLTDVEKEYLMDLASWEDSRLFRSTIEDANRYVNVQKNTDAGEDMVALASVYKKLKGTGFNSNIQVDFYDTYEIAQEDFSPEAIEENSLRTLTTNDIVEKALQDGSYDGVIIKNVVDFGPQGGYLRAERKMGNDYVIFNSEQFKNADNLNPTTNKEFQYSLSVDDYGMSHRPSTDYGDGSNFEENMPDVFEHPEWYFYGGNDARAKKAYKESFEALKRVRNNPEGEITIYRATIGDTINEGDWITPSRTYAEWHNYSNLDGKGNILELTVKAKDIRFGGDDLNEFGYFPNGTENFSLSNESDITPAPLRDKTAPQDIRLEVEEAIAPLKEEITQLKEELRNITDVDYAPATQEVVEQQGREEFNTLDDADMPYEVEEIAPVGEKLTPTDSLFDTRDYEEVGSKKVNAYQYDNPEVRPYFQTAAREMLTDLQNSTRGERFIIGDASQMGDNDYYYSGTKRATTDDIAELLDGMGGKYKYTYAEIEKGLRAIIEDNGKENNAVSKRIEFYLDKRLREGYTDIDGYEIPADEEYLDMLRAKGLTDYYNSIPLGEAPVESVDKPVDNVSNSKSTLKAEAIRPAPDKDTHGYRLIRVKTDTELETEANEEIAKILTEEPKTENTRNKRKWAILKANILDKGLVFEDVSLKHKNRELMGKWDYTLTADARGQNVIGNGHYEYDPYSKTSRQVSKSLNDIRAEVDNTGLTAEFYDYIYHKHNVDRMRLEGRFAGMENKPVFGYNVTSEQSQQVVRQYETQHPEFITFAQDVYDYLDADRQVLVDNGVISQETADLWKAMYPHYVPIRRAGHLNNAINVPLDTGRTGVNAPIKKATGGNKDILPLFDTMASRTLQTYRATAKNSFGVELKNTIGTTINSQATNVDEVIDSIDAQEDLLQEGKNGQKPTFTVFEDGEKITFEITPDMYDALKPLDNSSLLSKTFLPFNKASNFHRGLLTEYNPVFMLTNGIKDAQDILINSQHAAKTYAKVPEAFAQLVSKGYWYQEYMANGGEQNSYFDSVENTFKTENKGLAKILDLPPLSTISQLNNFIERTPRLAEYIASREAGKSIEVAMLDAARVTTNFKAGGNLTKWANRNGATFLNASVQGAMQQVRNIREANSNGIRGWANLATKFAIAGLPALLLNGLLWEDDEEYEELSDYVKQNYYIVAKNDDGTFIRIPKGRTLAVIQEGIQQMKNLATGEDEADLKTFIDLLLTNLAPNNPIENNILSPIIQAANNKTWYGEDLVPMRLQDLPAAEQYDEGTDSFSRWLGEKTNISPVKINYLLDQYSGGLGDVILPMLTPEAKTDADTLGEQLLAPLKSKFTTNSIMNNQNITDFYDASEELTTNAKKSNATDEDILSNKFINSIKAEMNKLYAEKREIQNSDLSNSEKYAQVLEVQKQINELAKVALNSYKDVNVYSNYATAGDRQYRLTDEGEWQKINDKQLEKQDNVTSSLNITPNDYWSNKEEYDYAYENPSKYALANAISDYSTFKQLSSELYDIKADKDENGKSISGTRKEKVFDYINNLDLGFEQRVMLAKMEYPSYDEYNNEIIEYLNNREDISYEQMVSILTELGFTVKKDGTITWD